MTLLRPRPAWLEKIPTGTKFHFVPVIFWTCVHVAFQIPLPSPSLSSPSKQKKSDKLICSYSLGIQHAGIGKERHSGAMLNPKVWRGNYGTSGVSEGLLTERYSEASLQAAVHFPHAWRAGVDRKTKFMGAPQGARHGAKCFVWVSTLTLHNTVPWALLSQFLYRITEISRSYIIGRRTESRFELRAVDSSVIS